MASRASTRARRQVPRRHSRAGARPTSWLSGSRPTRSSSSSLAKGCTTRWCAAAQRSCASWRGAGLGLLISSGRRRSEVETVKQCVYQVLVDLARTCRCAAHRAVRPRAAIPQAEYTTHTLALLRGFALAGISSPTTNRSPRVVLPGGAVAVMQDGSPVSSDLRLLAGMLQDLLGWQHCAAKRPFLYAPASSRRAAGPQSLRLCVKVASPPAQGAQERDHLVGARMARTHHLLLFFEDFRRITRRPTQRLRR